MIKNKCKYINGAFVPYITVVQHNLNPIFEIEEDYRGVGTWPCNFDWVVTIPAGREHYTKDIILCHGEATIKLTNNGGQNNYWYGSAFPDTSGSCKRNTEMQADFSISNCCQTNQTLNNKFGKLTIYGWHQTGQGGDQSKRCGAWEYSGKINCKLHKSSTLTRNRDGCNKITKVKVTAVSRTA